ncbi:MAG: cation:proton antiporter [Alphaproteobacteria bacterium]|nr:cation:proton antiporter [Alphaproteobacteria bacterium]
MQAHVEPGAYKDVVLLLAVAGVVVPIFRRWRVSPILGFLLAGVVLGPYGLGRLATDVPWLAALTISNPADVAQLAEFGVVFLLFTIGLELSWGRLRRMRALVFGLGALQVLASAVVLAGIAWALGQPLAAALSVGAALSLSSTAIVMPSLEERGRQHTPAGRAAFAILLFQDLAVAPMLMTIGLLSGGSGARPSPTILLGFVQAAIGVAVLVMIGRLILRPMFRSVAKARNNEMFVAACLLVVIGSALLSALAGLSMPLGAFIAGLLLAETEFRHQVDVVIAPFKGLLLGLFFVSVGIGLNLPLLVQHPAAVLGIAGGLLAVNGVVVVVLARAFGLSSRAAAEAGLLLAAGGEFAFVLLAGAMDAGLVARVIGQSVLVAVTLTMAATPLLAAAGARLGRARAAEPGLASEPEARPGGAAPRVLIAGYGRVGRLVGEMLERHAIPWVAAEQNQGLVEAGRRAGRPVFFGDASRAEFLTRAGLNEVSALVITMDDPEGAEAIVAVARGLRPSLTVVARARDARHARRLYELGATDAVPETVEASLQLSEAVLVDLGVPMGLVIASVHERRDEFRAELNRPGALGGRRSSRRPTEG